MGMELHGLNPKNHSGKIYRSSIWIWHPMWNYFELNHKGLIKNIDGHSNDGDTINEDLCVTLHNAILNDMSNNKIQKYLQEYDNFVNSLPETICEYCFGFGYERNNILAQSQNVCFRCRGTGKSKMFITNYKTYLHDFYMLATFLNNCGGCKIL